MSECAHDGCQYEAIADPKYCAYHRKVVDGLITDSTSTRVGC